MYDHGCCAIKESATKVEQRMEQIMDKKVHAVNKRLNASELHVLERPTPNIEVFAFRTELASLLAYLDTLIAPPILSWTHSFR